MIAWVWSLYFIKRKRAVTIFTMCNVHTYALKFINTLLESILSGYTKKMYKSVKFESQEGNGREIHIEN